MSIGNVIKGVMVAAVVGGVVYAIGRSIKKTAEMHVKAFEAAMQGVDLGVADFIKDFDKAVAEGKVTDAGNVHYGHFDRVKETPRDDDIAQ